VEALRFKSIEDLVKANVHKIADYDFKLGALVLVRNSAVEQSMDRKSKPL
jgi:hypothetical protein